MTTQFQRAYENIAVPFGLEQRVLTACLAQEKPTKQTDWRLTPMVSMAACGVLLASLAATGTLEGWVTAVEDWLIEPNEEILLQPGGTPTTAVTTTNRPLALSTTPTTTTTATKGTTLQTKVPITPGDTDSLLPNDVSACMRALPGDYTSMTLAELGRYFGRRIQPAWLPKDMRLQTTSIGNGVWYRNEEKMKNLTDWEKKQFENGTWMDGEVIYDQNAIHYLGKDNRTLSVAMSTAPYPRNMLGDMSRFDEDVTVAGVAAKLAFYDDSPYGGAGFCYTVLFTVDGIEFNVAAWNVPREEFLKIVKSIIE